MDKEKELNNTNEIVKELLETVAETRKCDNLMIALVVKELNPDALNMTFLDVLMNYNDLGLPTFETIRRTRQKNQAQNPDLKPDKKIQSFRNINAEIFKEYARH